MSMRKTTDISLALALTLALLAFTPKTFAQNYDQLESLSNVQATGKYSKLGVDKPVGNFGTIEAGLYRSMSPASLAEMKALAETGVKTIISMEGDKKKIAQEAAWSKSVGIKFISIPLSGFWAPKQSSVDEIQKLMRDQSQRPLLIHCAHGMERTGVQAALYRVFAQSWSAKKAYKEMKGYGFHSIDFPMKDYFEKATHTDL